jgi:hypothetical protein
MVSSFYNITEFFNRLSLAHPNITTFTFGNLDDIDLAKQTQFPLAHLIINNVEVASGKITYDVSYMVMDRVADITPESKGSNNELLKDYVGTDNSIDVWNSSLETINNIYSYIQRNPDNLDYDIDGDAVLTPFKDRFDNLLAGWGADFSITVGNENNICVLDPMSLEYVLPAIDMARVSVSASYAQSASYADTASYFSGSIEEALRSISSSYSLSSSFSLTASYVALPATYSQAFTASYAHRALTASYVVGNSQSSSFALTASYWSGSIISASFALRTDTASYALHAGNSMSASWASSSVSSSQAETASYAHTASYVALPATYSQAYTASYITGSNVLGIVSQSYSASLAETASYYAGAVELPDNLLNTGSLLTSQSLNGGLVVSGSITITGSGAGGVQTHTLQLNGTAASAFNYRGTNNSTGNTSSLLLGTGNGGFNYTNINNNGTASSEIRGTNTQASLAYTFSGSTNQVRANSTGVEVLGRSFSTTIPVTASSIRATAGFTGSLDGTASYAVSSSQAISSSYASSSLSSSFALTASYISGSTPGFPFTGSAVISGTLYVSNSTQGANVFATASNAISASYISGSNVHGAVSQSISSSYASSSLSASYAVTTSYAYDMEVANNLTIKGVLSASIFYADSASIIFTSGSNNFGNQITDLQILTGSVIITGSLSTTSPAYLSNITGSLYGTASFATTASYVELPATYSQAYTASIVTSSTDEYSITVDAEKTNIFYTNTDFSNYAFFNVSASNSGISMTSASIATSIGLQNYRVNPGDTPAITLNINNFSNSNNAGILLETSSISLFANDSTNNAAIGITPERIGLNGPVQVGNLSRATGANSLAAGRSNTTGIGAAALGIGNSGSGNYSFIAGQNNLASGYSSIVLGQRNRSTGDTTITIGGFLSASADRQVVIGNYNRITDADIIIGNGISETERFNAIQLFGTKTVISGTLEVSGNILGAIESASYVSSSQFINATSSANLVSNITDTFTASAAITNIVTVTQVEYDAITTKSSSTVYYII